MPLAAIGVLLAIGVPALQRGESLIGWGCIGGAFAVVLWLAISILRSHR
jgi:hypothetical protein